MFRLNNRLQFNIDADGYVVLNFGDELELPSDVSSLRSFSAINDGYFHHIKAELIPSKIILLVDDEVDHAIQISLSSGRWPLEQLFDAPEHVLLLGL